MTTGAITKTDTPTEAWVPDASTFGARLALVRQRMGWGNVKRAAEECGLPVQSWRTWERDGVTPNRLVTIAMAIATRTGADYLWLVHGPARGGLSTPNGRCGPNWNRARHTGHTGPPGIRRPAGSVSSAHALRPVTQTRPFSARLPERSKSLTASPLATRPIGSLR